MENAILRVTIKGKPSGIDNTIIINAEMKSSSTFINPNYDKTFSYTSSKCLTI